MSNKPITGLVFDIKKFAVHDGPGIRTTVFLKGCPLRCLWCHNPQSVAGTAQLAYDADKCIHCGACVDVCPEKCHRMSDGKHVLDREKCTACGSCVAVCLGNALERIGERRTVDDVLTEVLKDRAYYENSGGGLTVSGGEPLVQPAFTQALLTAAKAEGIHTCLDTCGQVTFEQYTKVIEFTDLIHYDIKETDPVRHQAYTGKDNALILENIRKLDMYGTEIILRCPIIPGYNDREEHFKAIGALGDGLKSVKRIDLMPYHPFGGKENEKIGQKAPITGIGAVKEEHAEEWIKAVRKFTEKEVKRG